MAYNYSNISTGQFGATTGQPLPLGVMRQAELEQQALLYPQQVYQQQQIKMQKELQAQEVKRLKQQRKDVTIAQRLKIGEGVGKLALSEPGRKAIGAGYRKLRPEYTAPLGRAETFTLPQMEALQPTLTQGLGGLEGQYQRNLYGTDPGFMGARGDAQGAGKVIPDIPLLETEGRAGVDLGELGTEMDAFGAGLGDQSIIPQDVVAQPLGASLGETVAPTVGRGARIAGGLAGVAQGALVGVGAGAGADYASRQGVGRYLEKQGIMGKKESELFAKTAGGAAGGALSAMATGAAFGSIIPGFGTAIGAGAGAVIGGIGGLIKGIFG